MWKEIIYSVGLQMGLELAVDTAAQMLKAKPRYLSYIEKQNLMGATIAIPTGYDRYGILFEVHGVRDEHGEVEYFALPRSHGRTPSHSIVNERVSMENFPAIASQYSQAISEARIAVANAVADGSKTRQSAAIWLEYNPVTTEWKTEPVSLEAVEAVAEAQIASLESLKVLAEDAPALEKLRARAVAWRELAEQFRTQIDNAGLSVVVADLVKANSEMSRAIEEAAADARRAKSFADFHGALALAGSVLGVAQSITAASANSSANYHIERERSWTLVTQHGEKLLKTELELRSRLQQSGAKREFLLEGSITDAIMDMKD